MNRPPFPPSVLKQGADALAANFRTTSPGGGAPPGSGSGLGVVNDKHEIQSITLNLTQTPAAPVLFGPATNVDLPAYTTQGEWDSIDLFLRVPMSVFAAVPSYPTPAPGPFTAAPVSFQVRVYALTATSRSLVASGRFGPVEAQAYQGTGYHIVSYRGASTKFQIELSYQGDSLTIPSSGVQVTIDLVASNGAPPVDPFAMIGAQAFFYLAQVGAFFSTFVDIGGVALQGQLTSINSATPFFVAGYSAVSKTTAAKAYAVVVDRGPGGGVARQAQMIAPGGTVQMLPTSSAILAGEWIPGGVQLWAFDEIDSNTPAAAGKVFGQLWVR